MQTEQNCQICQSCAMPLTEAEHFGTNADGSQNQDYCVYCYKDGAFTTDHTMDAMIEVCVPYCVESKVYPNDEAARAAMKAFFPQLKRWQS